MIFNEYLHIGDIIQLIRKLGDNDDLLRKQCYSCKRKFKVYEGSSLYKQFKERKSQIICCEECSHNIRLEEIKNFLRKF